MIKIIVTNDKPSHDSFEDREKDISLCNNYKMTTVFEEYEDNDENNFFFNYSEIVNMFVRASLLEGYSAKTIIDKLRAAADDLESM